MGIVGIGTAVLIVQRKKRKNRGGLKTNTMKAKALASISKLPGFSNFYGGAAFLANMARGVRNNNPGNIRLNGEQWGYEVPGHYNTDKSFKQFYSFRGGVRAMLINLRSYRRKGYVTIRQIIGRWSPPNENNTASYISNVSKYMKMHPDVPVPWDKHTVQKLVEAIIIRENGKLYFKQIDFDWAWPQVRL